MILAQGKHNKLVWHCVTEHGDEYRMICRPAFSALRKTVRNYSPNVLLCQDCKEMLWRLDPKWKLKLSKAIKDKDQPKPLFEQRIAERPKVEPITTTFDEVVKKLIISRRY